MTIAEKVDQAIKLEKSIKDLKRELDGVKAELQTAAVQEFENKNIKYFQVFGLSGSCESVIRQKFEIDNLEKLTALVGALVKDKIKVSKKEEVKYDINPRFKLALTALAKGNYKKHDINALLAGMDLDAAQIKVARKKLKGDYKNDRKVLQDLGVTGEREEELDAIQEAKNLELVEHFFDLQKVQLEEVKKCIFIEESLGIGLTYEDSEDNEEENGAA